MLFINKGQHDSYSDVSMVKATPTMILKLYKFKVHLYIRRYVWHAYTDLFIYICRSIFVNCTLSVFYLTFVCPTTITQLDEFPVIVCFSVVSQPWRTTYNHHWKLMNKLNPVPLLTPGNFLFKSCQDLRGALLGRQLHLAHRFARSPQLRRRLDQDKGAPGTTSFCRRRLMNNQFCGWCNM